MKRGVTRFTVFVASALFAIAGPALLLGSDVTASAKVPANADRGNSAGEERFDPGSYYRLTTQWEGDGKSLDVVNDGKNNNQLILADTGNYSGQHWKLTPLQGGYYRLTTEWQGSRKSLDVVNNGKDISQLMRRLVDSQGSTGKLFR